ncbi:hypothetical protein LUZ63_016678 [Rhynchospora breviuscula]|uniref:RING-type E3 ubiquitin transferase n=1 Tax=Rhynchospora breviuscula TaxID=2022672 RepID=A0A9P9ZB11_9POAL|nr:hypothetical protein LUZ63_016678 [Rhynchospora breviuscula]
MSSNSTDSNLSGNCEAFNGKALLTGLIIVAIFLVVYIVQKCLVHENGRIFGNRFVRRSYPPRQSGLRRSVIAKLPVVAYQKGREDGDGDGPDECTVCLGELEEGEQVRVLPRCKHLFHVDCIDTWLHSHSTCPVCRASAKPLDSVRSPGSLPPGVMAGLADAKETGLTSGFAASFRQMLNRDLSGRTAHSSIEIFHDLERQ